MRLPGTILACAVVCVATLAVADSCRGGDAPAPAVRVAGTATPTGDASPTPSVVPTVTVTETATQTLTVTATPCVPGVLDRWRARDSGTEPTCSPATRTDAP